MADSYRSASFCIAVKDSKVATERMKLLECFINNVESSLPETLFAGKAEFVRKKLDGHHDGMGFAWEVDDKILCLYHEESIDIEQAIAVAQIMLELDENPHIYTAEWADTCSKPRAGEFGGGSVAFTSRYAGWMSTLEVSRDLEKKLKARIEDVGLLADESCN